MIDEISFLPSAKQKELEIIVEIIKSKFININYLEKIILFWSYARWDFVDKDLIMEWINIFEYNSDFDLIIITSREFYYSASILVSEIKKDILSNKDIKTPVWLLLEDSFHVNARLAENRYFYVDIKNQWIILYNSNSGWLWDTNILSNKDLLRIKKEDFYLWYNSASEFLDNYKFFSSNIWVFQLHQAAERFITAYMLVKIWYKPKTHDLLFLYDIIKNSDPIFNNWFLDSEYKYLDLLKKWYIEARYSSTYKITKEELDFIWVKVFKLKELIHKLSINILK